jgi:hypothetical protein
MWVVKMSHDHWYYISYQKIKEGAGVPALQG